MAHRVLDPIAFRHLPSSQHLFCRSAFASRYLHSTAHSTEETNGKQRSYYHILQVRQTASKHEIKLSYLTLAKKLHPDSGREASVRPFLELVEAYECLSCPRRRAEYDISLNQPTGFPFRPAGTEANSHSGAAFTERSRSDPYGQRRRAAFGFQEPYRPGQAWNRESQLAKLRKGETLLRRLQLELDDALDMAYNGPEVRGFLSLCILDIWVDFHAGITLKLEICAELCMCILRCRSLTDSAWVL